MAGNASGKIGMVGAITAGKIGLEVDEVVVGLVEGSFTGVEEDRQWCIGDDWAECFIS